MMESIVIIILKVSSYVSLNKNICNFECFMLPKGKEAKEEK